MEKKNKKAFKLPFVDVIVLYLDDILTGSNNYGYIDDDDYGLWE